MWNPLRGDEANHLKIDLDSPKNLKFDETWETYILKFRRVGSSEVWCHQRHEGRLLKVTTALRAEEAGEVLGYPCRSQKTAGYVCSSPWHHVQKKATKFYAVRAARRLAGIARSQTETSGISVVWLDSSRDPNVGSKSNRMAHSYLVEKWIWRNTEA